MNYVEHLNLFGVEAKEIPCITGSGAPTNSTEGAVGCFYMDTDTGDVYKCVGVSDGVHDWRRESSDSVKYTPQNLTDAEKAQARKNIGVDAIDYRGNMIPMDMFNDSYTLNGVTVTFEDGVFTLNGTNVGGGVLELIPRGTPYLTLNSGVTYYICLPRVSGESSVSYPSILLNADSESVAASNLVKWTLNVNDDKLLTRFALAFDNGSVYKDYKIAPFIGIEYPDDYTGAVSIDIVHLQDTISDVKQNVEQLMANSDAVTTEQIVDGAVTFKKRTATGSYGLLWSKYGVLEFDTVNHKLKIPAYAELCLGGIKYSNTVGFDGRVIDLTDMPYATVVYNIATSDYTVYAYDNYTARPETLIPIAAYTEYGKTVFTSGPYKIDGALYGFDETTSIRDGSITKEKLAPKLMQNHLSRCPQYTFTDMSQLDIHGWSDICIIGENLWMFIHSTDEEHVNSNGTIRIVNKETLEVVKSITHNFGHVNTCDYCKETDCLIVGNLPGNSIYPAALYIFYNVSGWANVETLDFATVEKTIIDMRGGFPSATAAACSWGESNFAYNNIAYVSFGYNKQFTKIVLGMGTNQLTNGIYTAADADKFNGTYNILLTSDFDPMSSDDEVIQGATFYKGRMLTANGDAWTARASLWQFDINGNIQRELWEFPIYNANGQKNSQYKTYTEGITVDEETGYIYQGIYSGQLQAIRFYLIKYKL